MKRFTSEKLEAKATLGLDALAIECEALWGEYATTRRLLWEARTSDERATIRSSHDNAKTLLQAAATHLERYRGSILVEVCIAIDQQDPSSRLLLLLYLMSKPVL